jgi:hypothetical protein
MHSVIELRKSRRYQLKTPVFFEWAPQDGKPQSGEGVTRDINTFGVYVVTEASPPAGALVQMEVILPKLADSGSGMHLHGEGVVLRSDVHRTNDAGLSERGFAASVQFYPEAAASALSQMEITGDVV